MRAFWQSIALLLLVAFAPATAHCLAGHPELDAHEMTAIGGDCCDHTEQHSHSDSAPDHPSHSDHDCPTETLTKSNLPTPLLVPALPCQALDHALVALRHIASQMTAMEASSMEAHSTSSPQEWITTWAFTSRAALPPRSPSDLA